MPIDCATAGLEIFVGDSEHPWDNQKVQHLYRRLTFGAPLSDINAGLLMSPSDLVDQIVDAASALPLSTQPDWAYWNVNDYTDINTQGTAQILSWTENWLYGMLQNGLRDRLTLFWHNHLVTRLENYLCPSYMYQYHRLLEEHSMGNFKEFIHAIGTTPAMLVFLNNVQNTVVEPNENYARELYELFTLGQDNGYTQSDIAETARALTGFNGLTVGCGPIDFVPLAHDNGQKTIFEQTGNWGYDDIINILFEQRSTQIAVHICGKIYKEFVGPIIDQDIVDALAQTFIQNDWELIPVYKQLLKSAHFFDENNIGLRISSPLESFFGMMKSLDFPYDNETVLAVFYLSGELGQELWNPVDVAGWQGNHDWINSSRVVGRWQVYDYYIFGTYENAPEALRNWVIDLTNNSNDPAYITEKIIDFILPKGLQNQMAIDEAITVFKWEVPQNYYEDGTWNLNWEFAHAQTGLLLRHLFRKPEYQLA